ncbi:putative DNA delivery protein [Bacillus phage Wip1]|uniref:Putative DNA delivery protein n=1 Tax=Bacillus phage Wip1 TaxID=663237 RepID=S5XZZ5_9VIRU|nr:putative DNA delivery protein [Bacillus phage Wip1]AGT13374.1 putative DNA delivery protein [Bacillus phage Wip1]
MDRGLTFFTLALLLIWLVFDDLFGEKKYLSKLAGAMTPNLSLPDPARDAVDKVVEDTKENAKKDVTDIKKDTKDAVKDTKKSFDDFINGGFEKEMKKDVNDFKDWTKDLPNPDKMKEKANNDFKAIWDEVSKALEDTKKSANDMWDDVTSSVKGWFK